MEFRVCAMEFRVCAMNVFGLRDEVSKHEDNFALGFTVALIAYGLGRPFGFTDQDLVDEIMRRAREKRGSFF